MRLTSLLIIAFSACFFQFACAQNQIRVLAFSQVEDGVYHHLSNLKGIALIEKIGKKQGWHVDVTHDPGSFNVERLMQYDVVAFINSTGNILNEEQEAAFEQFFRAGGGYVGTHSAADTEHGWEWYGKMLGGYFKSHPDTDQNALTIKENGDHPANKYLGETGVIFEEWYDYTANVRGKDGFTVLLSVDESTYEGGITGDDHPITWAHEFEGGRAFYTGLGHFFQEDHPFLAEQLIGGVEWAAGR